VIATARAYRQVVNQSQPHLTGKTALSIDSKIQYITFFRIAQAVSTAMRSGGRVVVMRAPRVLALANLPDLRPEQSPVLTGEQLRNGDDRFLNPVRS